MAIIVQQYSEDSLTIIAEPTGDSDGEELNVPMRSVHALMKKLEAAKKKHDKAVAARAKGRA